MKDFSCKTNLLHYICYSTVYKILAPTILSFGYLEGTVVYFILTACQLSKILNVCKYLFNYTRTLIE